jgi:hypothetical protein
VATTLRTLAPFPQPGPAAMTGADGTYQAMAAVVAGLGRTRAGAVAAMGARLNTWQRDDAGRHRCRRSEDDYRYLPLPRSDLQLPVRDIYTRHEPFLPVRLARGHRALALLLLAPMATAPPGAQFGMLEVCKTIRDWLVTQRTMRSLG